jgi:trehalose 6-phosphate phosphatase
MDGRLIAALERIATVPELLVAADFDGTLSPLVPNPADARPHEPALDALVRLSSMRGVHGIIISGRERSVLADLTGAPEPIVLIGTHGTEAAGGSSDPVVAAQVREVVDALEQVAAAHEGTLLEPKPSGASLHYRHAVDQHAAAAAAEQVGLRFGVRMIHGKQVVELLVGDGDKGTAIAAHQHRVGATAVVFLGDDTTDEDVFRNLGTHDVGVKVGEGETAAEFRVGDPDGVADVLESLIAVRSTGVGSDAPPVG